MKLKNLLEGDDEGSMARSELKRTAKISSMLLDKIKDGDELPAWTQSKITKALDYVQSVFNYMDGDKLQEGPFDKSKISQDLEQSYKSYVDAVFALTSAARKTKDPKMDKILKNIKKETQALMDHVSGNYTDLDFK